MSYKFEANEQVRSAIRRCAQEQLDRAITDLSDGIATDPTSAIHDARKSIKKGRSLLRLARGAMPRAQRRRENAALRDAARGLSGARDADVMIASVDQLSERYAGQLPATTFDSIREHLAARRSAQIGRRGGRALEARAVPELGTVRVRTDDWKLRKTGWKALEGGLLRTYKRGRRAFARTRSGGEMEDLHAWRKRVKDLWYQERLLGAICGPAIRGHAKELHRLSDLLGDDHDLALLRQELTRDGAPVAADLDAVVNLIDHRRMELQTQAIRIGERLYAEPPNAFRRRTRAAWNAGRALARVPEEQHPSELAAATR